MSINSSQRFAKHIYDQMFFSQAFFFLSFQCLGPQPIVCIARSCMHRFIFVSKQASHTKRTLKSRRAQKASRMIFLRCGEGKQP